MSAEAIATLIKMMESLPEAAQGLVVAHLREYIEDLRDELQWDLSFEKTQKQLAAAGKRAKQEIAEARARPMNFAQLQVADSGQLTAANVSSRMANEVKGDNRFPCDVSSKPPSTIEWE